MRFQAFSTAVLTCIAARMLLGTVLLESRQGGTALQCAARRWYKGQIDEAAREKLHSLTCCGGLAVCGSSVRFRQHGAAVWAGLWEALDEHWARLGQSADSISHRKVTQLHLLLLHAGLGSSARLLQALPHG